ncbi:hypothetical protein [Priestia endophytica]|uniref:Uncharacterized protein n=1 Tax=Priestia endophytica TaxID=135735 RepID=A0AAX1Q6A7_9BACI|nr:hypothetical protein [Priestia endophytica]RAS75226.1 hypothetical protein A3864_16300 [Priestia endophytica]
MSLIGAFVGAVIAQVLSHWFSVRREKSKSNKEIYQEFVYPFLTEVILFYETETDFRRGHDVEKEIPISGVIEKMSKKISYGNTKLMSAFHSYKSSSYFFDGRGYGQERELIKLLFWYLDCVVNVLNKLPKKDKETIHKVKDIQKHYGIWYLVFEKLDSYEDAVKFMQLKDSFPKCYMKNLSIDDLHWIIDSNPKDFHERVQEFLENFINMTDVELEEENQSIEEGSAFYTLKKVLKDYREINYKV